MLEFALRFVCGGLLVAALPWVSAAFGATVGGLVLLFPAVSLAGFIALGLDEDVTTVGRVALGSLLALPVVALFLLGTHVAARHGASLVASLSIGLTGWFAGATVFLLFRSWIAGGAR